MVKRRKEEGGGMRVKRREEWVARRDERVKRREGRRGKGRGGWLYTYQSTKCSLSVCGRFLCFE
jgi:hypothetical protein